MARPGLKTVSVYVNEAQHEVITKAAAKRRRSLSNYLLTLALEDAENELGMKTFGRTTDNDNEE